MQDFLKESILIEVSLAYLGYCVTPSNNRVLRHSVKQQTLPQDSSLIERIEIKSYSDLAGMMPVPAQSSV
jgi:hypothetical protein